MAESADNLRASVGDYISNNYRHLIPVPEKQIPYFKDYMIFGGDAVWKDPNQQGSFLLMEQKTLQEARDNNSNWWNWNSKREIRSGHCGLGHYNLGGYRSLVSHVLDVTPADPKTLEVRRIYKWVQVIAQLRYDILNLDHTRIRYRSTFALPLEELDNFKSSFQLFHSSHILNPFRYTQEIIIYEWKPTLYYSDVKYRNVETVIVEVQCENYFSQIITRNLATPL